MNGKTVRDLLRGATTATLATHDAATGHPYASLVEIATMADGRPLMLLSGLARHTRNLEADPRASLLVDQRGGSQPLTAERAAIIGQCQRCGDEQARRRYLARFPASAAYADFSDFGFWVLEPSLAHVIAGFGRIGEVAGTALVIDGEASLEIARQEAELLASVNISAEQRGVGARAVGIDPEGVDLALGDRLWRVALEAPVTSVETILETMD